MPLLSDTRHLEFHSRPAGEGAQQRYLTDGRSLFRVVTPFAISEADAHVFMSLEDCMTLNVQSYSPQQLYRMGLRSVVASAS